VGKHRLIVGPEVRHRRLARLLAVGVACIFLGGCGSSGSSGGGTVVASVAGVPVTKASLEHWARIESIVSYKVIPTEAVPKGVWPDPPNFTACIAWLGSSAGPLESHSMSAAQRKAGCEARLRNLKQKTLEFLVLYQWYLGEAKEKGIKVPESEVRRNLARFIREEMPGKFPRYLSATGMSEADALFIQRLTTYGEKVKDVILAKPNPTEMRQALVGFTSKWVAKTDCKPGYVYPGCSQYHGSEPPP